MDKPITTTIRLPADLVRQIKHLAADGKVKNLNMLIIDLIKKYLEEVQK